MIFAILSALAASERGLLVCPLGFTGGLEVPPILAEEDGTELSAAFLFSAAKVLQTSTVCPKRPQWVHFLPEVVFVLLLVRVELL
jgi:hypothetical protein